MIYRTEHPKPQFEREQWQCLNGEWQFEIDHCNSGTARGMQQADFPYTKVINVPFCPESKLSGLEYIDFMNAVWYRREIFITAEQLKGRIFLHCGAVDYEAEIYVNGILCGSHRGGYVSFKVELTDALREGVNTLAIHAIDDTRSGLIASGKQSLKYESNGCFYTRTTGIWQSVWLEFTPKAYIDKVHYAENAEQGSVTIQASLCGSGTLQAEIFFEGKPMGKGAVISKGGEASLTIELAETHLWDIGKGNLYDVALTFGEDRVKSYFGLRTICFEGLKFMLNGRSVFQRLVLDQGFYPDGLYTAPSDAELEADIDRALAMGFNGARLHEKVFEERFLYHADRKGYLVWGEYPNWGLDHADARMGYPVLDEWLEEVDRDKDHPSIIGWCPFNETTVSRQGQYHPILSTVYRATKLMDPTRPCLDASGWLHVESDVFDVHCYEQDPEILKSYYTDLLEKGEYYERHFKLKEQPMQYKKGMPFFVSEYGGIAWDLDGGTGWGYGQGPKTREEFIERLRGLTDVLLDHPAMFAYCYTQLTDIEQEQNGLYTYDRKPKFPPEEIYPIFSKKAAIED